MPAAVGAVHSARGGVLVEQTRAVGVDDTDGVECVVTTERGVVRADAVVKT